MAVFVCVYVIINLSQPDQPVICILRNKEGLIDLPDNENDELNARVSHTQNHTIASLTYTTYTSLVACKDTTDYSGALLH